MATDFCAYTNLRLIVILPEPFDTRSLLPMGVLTGCSIRVSSEVKDQNGQYAPFKYLWWVILGWTIIGILFGITIKAPLELHIALIVHAIAGGIGYRLIERYAVYRYHYLQTKRKANPFFLIAIIYFSIHQCLLD